MKEAEAAERTVLWEGETVHVVAPGGDGQAWRVYAGGPRQATEGWAPGWRWPGSAATPQIVEHARRLERVLNGGGPRAEQARQGIGM